MKQADAFRQQKEADALMKEAETLANVCIRENGGEERVRGEERR